MSRSKLLILFLLAFINLSIFAHAQEQEKQPYRFEYELEVLVTALSGLANDDQHLFLNNMVWYDRIVPPVKLRTLHEKISKTLYNISYDLVKLTNITNICNAKKEYNKTILDLLQTWIYFRNQLIKQYKAVGLSYVDDTGYYFIVNKNLTETLNAIESKISQVVLESKIRIKMCNIAHNITLTIEPKKIYAGGILHINISGKLPYYNGTIYLYVNNKLIYHLELNSSYSFDLRVPSYEELDSSIRRTVELSKKASLLVEYFGYDQEGAQVYGYAVGFILFRRPSITILCPERTRLGINSTIYLFNKESYEFNATILFNNFIEKNIIITPGVTEIVVGKELLKEPGTYVVDVIVNGTGPFVANRLQCAFSVEDPIMKATLTVSPIALVWLTKIKFVGGVDLVSGINTINLSIYINNNRIKTVDIRGGHISIEVPPNNVLFAKVERVSLVYEFDGIKRVLISSNVMVLNPIIIIITIIMITFIAPFYSLNLIEGLQHFVLGITTSFRMIAESRIEGLSKTYKAIVSAVATLVSPPLPSETLREYLLRARKVLPLKIYLILEDTILLYERVVYSNRRDPVTEKRLRELVEKLRRKR